MALPHRLPHLAGHAAGNQTRGGYPTPEPLEQDPGISEELRAALNTLAPLDRALILERVLDGLDYAALVRIHGRPAAYLRTRYHRAKKQLAQRLKEGEHYEV